MIEKKYPYKRFKFKEELQDLGLALFIKKGGYQKVGMNEDSLACFV